MKDSHGPILSVTLEKVLKRSLMTGSEEDIMHTFVIPTDKLLLTANTWVNRKMFCFLIKVDFP